MDTTMLIAAASQAGVTGPAMVDALARGQTYFSAKETTTEHLTAWVTELKNTAPHLFTLPATGATAAAVAAKYGVPHDVWAKMSPADRMSYARQGQPPCSPPEAWPVRSHPGAGEGP